MTTLQESMDKLANLFGATKGMKLATKCYGKYAGMKDYSVLFDNDQRYYISLGYKNFKSRIETLIDTFEKFNEKKQEILNIFKAKAEEDNAVAREQGLKEYKLLDVDYAKHGSYIGWFYVMIEVDGKIVNHIETHTSQAIRCYSLTGEFDQGDNREYFIAGGLHKADYVLNNAGFDSKSDLYNIKVV